MSGAVNIWICTFGLIAIGVAAQGSITVVVEPTAKPIVGQDVKIHCRIKGFTPGDFINWNKKMDDDKIHIIGTNIFINYPFADTNRYAAAVADSPDEKVYTLSIANIQLEDAGQIGCGMPSKREQAFQTVVVSSDSTDLTLTVGGSTQRDTDSVMLEEGAPIDIMCEVSGSNPAPMVQMFVGDMEITNDMPTNEPKEVVGIDNDGLKSIMYSHKLAYPQWKASTESSGYILKCVSKVEGFDEQTASIELKMIYAAQLNCPPSVSFPMYEKNAVVTCHAKANPALTMIEWSWDRFDDRNSTEKLACDTNSSKPTSEGKYFCSLSKDADTTEVKFRIGMIHQQHFRNYELSISNGQGSDSKMVEVIRDKTREYQFLAKLWIELSFTKQHILASGMKMDTKYALGSLVLICAVAIATTQDNKPKEGPPQINCQPAKFPNYHKEANITCHVYAYPFLDDMMWQFTSKSGHLENVTMDNPNGKFRLEHRIPSSPGGVSYNQTIALVRDEWLHAKDFRDYTLTVSNSEGQAKETVTLERDRENEKPTGSAAVPVMSLATILFSYALSHL
ncbi:unnamed protein product [Owenia fusiformis]|uniref:Uncharacterized protein n=1 Tax=Owenia fusiformis TaxID=6347 RepID=A0A8J1YAZ4_OWEFU|nr:unnamed protein product [Owenia fusiformis]